MDTGKKTLLYVPVIHTRADLGSLGVVVAKRGITALGEEAWRRHTETVNLYWKALKDYFDAMDVKGVKIYQDGMAADGEVAEKMVEQGVRSGSKNYEIVSSMLRRGAVLVKTEDFSLLKKEYDRLLAMSRAAGALRKVLPYLRYRLVKGALLKDRDKYVAKRINETLGYGETGVLFIGAYHDVRPWLGKDIRVVEIKEIAKVRGYQKRFIFWERHRDEIDSLARYLASPPEAPVAGFSPEGRSLETNLPSP